MTPAGIFAPFILDARGVSHIGHVREENQDDYLVDAGAGLFAVADGVGGLKDGRHASRTVIEALTGLPGFSSLNELRDSFEAGVARANHALRLFVRENGGALGTTLAALLIHDHAILCAWAGDSRIYRLRGQALTLLTDDHTEAAELLRQGTLTAEEARVWPRRNVITRAIGVEDTVDLDYKSGSIQPGDIYLLCSDGLTTHLSDAEILTAISGRSLDEAAEALIGATLREGGERQCHGHSGWRSPGIPAISAAERHSRAGARWKESRARANRAASIEEGAPWRMTPTLRRTRHGLPCAPVPPMAAPCLREPASTAPTRSTS